MESQHTTTNQTEGGVEGLRHEGHGSLFGLNLLSTPSNATSISPTSGCAVRQAVTLATRCANA